ncbi:hypothetical protein [Reyranella sp.]|uniref:hypothetical protein n=1 Tax=Reyranella sp. TaxID=1929291 RepID=UPI003D149C39
MSKNRHLLLALTNSVPGQEDAFNDWYDAYHVQECLKVRGFKSCQRFKLTASQHDQPRQAYLALYELEGDDPKALLKDLEATRSDRTQSPAFDRESVSLWVFSPIAEKQYSHESDD